MFANSHTSLLFVVFSAQLACSGNIDTDAPDEDRPPGRDRSAEGDDTRAGDVADGDAQLPPFQPAPARMRRLTSEEYRNSVRDLLGEPLNLPVDLEPDVYLFGFTSVGSTASDISSLGIERYESAAYALAGQVFASEARRRALLGCAPTTVTDPCVGAFVQRFGRRAWRRPLGEDEVAQFIELAAGLSRPPGSVSLALEHVVAAFLQAPSFLYRAELGQPDSQPLGRRRFDGWDMAARLSFLFWATTPDDEMLDAAAAGSLDDSAGIREQAGRLLAAKFSRQGVLRFFSELLELRKLDGLEKDPARFPSAKALGPHMRSEAERMIEAVVMTRDIDVRDLLVTRDTFLNDALARHYGLPEPGGNDFAPVTLPAGNPRAGLFGLAGFLSLLADGTSTSPTLRGKFVREVLLCQDIPAPPEGVDTEFEPEDPGRAVTGRQKLDDHRDKPACASCHGLMDPIGFAMEHFDALGAYRDKDNGLPIDATGDLDGEPFDGLKALAAVVRAAPSLDECLVRTAYRFSTAHEESEGEEIVLARLLSDFRAGGRRFTRLLTDIASSDGFRFATDPR